MDYTAINLIFEHLEMMVGWIVLGWIVTVIIKNLHKL